MSQIRDHLSKEYVGDGVYIQIYNKQMMLTTEDGLSVQNTIYLDTSMVEYIHKYMQKFYIRRVEDGNNQSTA